MEWMPPLDGIKCAIVMFANVTAEDKACGSAPKRNPTFAQRNYLK